MTGNVVSDYPMWNISDILLEDLEAYMQRLEPQRTVVQMPGRFLTDGEVTVKAAATVNVRIAGQEDFDRF